MAKKQSDQQTEKPSRGKAYGLYINRELLADLEKIAEAETGGKLHEILQLALRHFVRDYKAGKIKLKKETVTRLKLD
jgi:hypothetical protein